jgi:hypothetical protein
MMGPRQSNAAVKIICAALGLPANKLYSLTIELCVDGVVKAQAGFYPDISDEELATIAAAVGDEHTTVHVDLSRVPAQSQYSSEDSERAGDDANPG